MGANGASFVGRGRFIVFEGIDGSGKSTQVNRLANWLSGLTSLKIPNIIVTREPGGTDFGQQLRNLLLDESTVIHPTTELLLYMADRAQHIETLLKPALSRGEWVICDRFTDSTIAYQGYGKGLSVAHIHFLNQITVNYLKPDLTFWLKIDPSSSLSRLKSTPDRIEKLGSDYFVKVNQGFTQIAIQYPRNREIIDATPSANEVENHIKSAIAPYLTAWQNVTLDAPLRMGYKRR